MKLRCLYCGHTELELMAIMKQKFNSTEIMKALCPCCDHCFECKLILNRHKYDEKDDDQGNYLINDRGDFSL